VDLVDIIAIILVIAVATATFAGDAPIPWLRSAARVLSGRNGLPLPNDRFLSYRTIEGAFLIIAAVGWLIVAPGRQKLFSLALVGIGVWRIRTGLRERPWGQQMQTLMSSRKARLNSSKQLDSMTAEEDIARRARLSKEALSSLPAARQLHREIEDELETIDDILRYTTKERPNDKEGIQGLEMYRKELEQELSRVNGVIRHLHA
jgi:hypothetical protein